MGFFLRTIDKLQIWFTPVKEIYDCFQQKSCRPAYALCQIEIKEIKISPLKPPKRGLQYRLFMSHWP